MRSEITHVVEQINKIHRTINDALGHLYWNVDLDPSPFSEDGETNSEMVEAIKFLIDHPQ